MSTVEGNNENDATVWLPFALVLCHLMFTIVAFRCELRVSHPVITCPFILDCLIKFLTLSSLTSLPTCHIFRLLDCSFDVSTLTQVVLTHSCSVYKDSFDFLPFSVGCEPLSNSPASSVRNCKKRYRTCRVIRAPPKLNQFDTHVKSIVWERQRCM